MEQLIRFFVEVEAKECFAACLFTCFELVRPDVVMELAWRNNIMDYAMPYFIQVSKNYTAKVDALVAAAEKAKVEKEKEHENEVNAGVGGGMDPYSMGMQGGMGMGGPQSMMGGNMNMGMGGGGYGMGSMHTHY